MKTRLLPSLILIALLGAACTPQATPTQAPPNPVILEPSASPLLPAAPTLEAPTQDLGAVQAPPTQTPIPVATSRGPDLHATDPTTVSLASGQYQFVEFFRFT
ncbi:MAG TPA: hypothetical protein VMJ90_05895 [Anaerolineales bacterium]|nr:hypothetical protein [Anaerolineales bacterium]